MVSKLLTSIIILGIGSVIFWLYLKNQNVIDTDGQWLAYTCIIYDNRQDTNRDTSTIMLVNIDDTSESYQLATHQLPNRVGQPAWSSSNLIAYEYNHTRIRVVSLNSNENYTIGNSTSTTFRYFPSWSPDNTRIAYVRHLSDLYVYNLDTSQEVELASFSSNIHGSTWLPDGQSIAIEHNNQLLIVDVETQEIEILLEMDVINDTRPTWSPDGRYIVFGGIDDEIRGLYSIELEANETTLLYEGSVQSPSWSPDGNYISFTLVTSDGSNSIILLNPSNGQIDELSTDARCDRVSDASWSPNISG